MSEYWKSTPKYWCKHCSVYVRDTKLERTNHEATGKHQGAIKRSLRDLHRTAEQAEREKERAKREVDRLNGVVSSSGGGPSSKTSTTKSQPQNGSTAEQITQAERQRQLEQLAELGVAIPTELRKDMAMVGEWSVTSTRVIDDGEGNSGESKSQEGEEGEDLAGRAVGVKRSREMTEDEKEREEALNGLFNQNKKRKWGVGSKIISEGEDEDLDALLSGGLVVKKKEDVEDIKAKTEEDQLVTKEEPQERAALESAPDVKTELPSQVKQEPVEHGEGSLSAVPSKKGSEVPAVIFKKRKAKNVRQK
ncbi:hypothetical protein QBC43DRAFT_14935 [Cladorrhinum sp. PSN259]|nr:hypothetical protein QBC43DRAFT_14935 [Cladorrhinum sp. PSN259]